jgi:hypothetical protein
MPMMFFHFLKIIFDISISKRSKKYKPHSILVKIKKFSKFDETQLQTQCQTVLFDGEISYRFSYVRPAYRYAFTPTKTRGVPVVNIAISSR